MAGLVGLVGLGMFSPGEEELCSEAEVRRKPRPSSASEAESATRSFAILLPVIESDAGFEPHGRIVEAVARYPDFCVTARHPAFLRGPTARPLCPSVASFSCRR